MVCRLSDRRLSPSYGKGKNTAVLKNTRDCSTWIPKEFRPENGDFLNVLVNLIGTGEESDFAGGEDLQVCLFFGNGGFGL